MNKFFDKALEKYPFVTIAVVAALACAVAGGLGILTPISTQVASWKAQLTPSTAAPAAGGS